MTITASALWAATDTGTATASVIWTQWNTFYATITASATTDTIWYAWNSGTAANNTTLTATAGDTVYRYYTTPAELEEQARRAREREDELLRQAAEQRRIAEEAEERAEGLLREQLNPDQAAEFEKTRSFTVISKDGQRRYRVDKGFQRNIVQLDDKGKPVLRLCAHACANLPDFDHMLAQKLWLEHDEELFVKIANKGAA